MKNSKRPPKRAVIFHGTQGSPEGNWFRWLEKTLQNRGLEVWLPVLPKATAPSLKEWVEFVRRDCPFTLDQDTIVIGHSSGAILAFLLLQSGFDSIGAVVGVSVFLENSINWEPNNRLFDVQFDWPVIAAQPTRRLVINSDTDPYVPIIQAKTIAQRTNTELVVIPNQGHFNLEQSPDYTQFPMLIECLTQRQLL